MLAFVAAISFGALTFAPTVSAEVKEAPKKVEIYQLAPNALELSHCYVIKTVNDKIIVMDGGLDNAKGTYNGNSYLPEAIRAILGLGEDEHFTVDAWFLSHAHNDHIAELARILNGYEDGDGQVTYQHMTSEPYTGAADTFANAVVDADDNFTIKDFYFDFPEASELKDSNGIKDISDGYLWDLEQGLNKYALANGLIEEGDNYYDQINGAVVNADSIKAGLDIEIDGVRFEILQTWNEWDGNANDMSMVVRVWVDGQSVMFLGDVDNAASNRLLYNYGAGFLKSDVVQLAHHGQNGSEEIDPATGELIAPLYTAIDADVRLWASHQEIWEKTKDDYTVDKTIYEGKNALVGSGTPTAWVRNFFGLGYDAFTESTATDLVACLSTHPADNGTTVASWTEEVLDSMKIELPSAISFETENNFKMLDGASMRLNDAESTGIRFAATMDSYDTESTYGMVIVPRDYIEGNEITGDYVNQLVDIYGEKGIINLTCKVINYGSQYGIQGSIANILYSNMGRQFTGIAYELTKDGEYVYAAFDDLNDISRSVFNVATKSANLDTVNGGEYFTEDQDAWIENYIAKSVAASAGISKADYDAGSRADATIDLTIDGTVELLQPVKFTVTSTFDPDTIEYSYDKEALYVDTENNTITVLKTGTHTLIAYAAYWNCSKTIELTTSDIKDDYLATFDSPLYKNYIRRVDDVNCGGIRVEWLEEYRGETGVLKVAMTNDNSGSKDSQWVLDLFKDYTNGYTVKYYLEDLFTNNGKVNAIRWYKVDENDVRGSMISVLYPTANLPYDKWTTEYVAVSDTANSNRISFHTEAGDGLVMYLSWVRDGDAVTRDAEAAKAAAIEEMRADLASKEGVLATFDHAGYQYFIGEPRTSSYSVEYLESYTDVNGVTRNGVLKVTMKTYTETGPWEGVKLELLNNHSGTYTIEYLADYTSGQIAFYKTSGYNSLFTNYTPASNTWVTKTVTMNEASNAIYFGVVNDAANSTLTFYLSLILDGSVSTDAYYVKESLKADLDTNELASFDLKEYESLVHKLDADDTITATYLESFKGEKGVLKVEIDNSADVANSGLYLDLVKSINATNGYTVRMYAECNNKPQAIYIKTANTYGTPASDALNLWDDKYWNNWQSLYITAVGSELNSFYILTYSGADYQNSTSYTFYFSVIMDGDQRTAIMETNRANVAQTITEENVLAKFDSEDYLALLDLSSTSGRIAPYTAEIVDDPLATENARKVLKLSITLTASSAWDFVTLYLPKAYTNNAVTVEYYVPADNVTGGDLAFIPEDDSFSSYHFATTQGAWTKKVSKWADKSGSNIEIGKVNTNKDGTVLVVYVACVYDGTVA